MKQYIGALPVHASSKDKEGKPGFTVTRADNTQEWVPKELFDHFYSSATALSCGLAIEVVNRGGCVRRAKWPPGEYLHLALQSQEPRRFLSIHQPKARIHREKQWQPSAEDLLAKDWIIGTK
jgi:hypothetical protein